MAIEKLSVSVPKWVYELIRANDENTSQSISELVVKGYMAKEKEKDLKKEANAPNQQMGSYVSMVRAFSTASIES